MWKKLWYSLYSFARTNLVLCRIHETQGRFQTVQTGKRRFPFARNRDSSGRFYLWFVRDSTWRRTKEWMHARARAHLRGNLRLSQRCECGRKLLHFFLPCYTRRNLPMPGISSQICAALIKDYYRARRHAFFPAFSLSLSLPSPLSFPSLPLFARAKSRRYERAFCINTRTAFFAAN